MTQAEWLASDDVMAMVTHLTTVEVGGGRRPPPDQPVSDRKLRLWFAAMMDASAYDYGVPTAWREGEPCDREYDLHVNARQWADAAYDNEGDPPMEERAALLREMVGDPFRAAFTLAKVPAKWGGCLTPAALSLARAAYDERDFGLLPILADALADAGCEDDALLAHLRSPGPHVRGCWALDLVLGLA